MGMYDREPNFEERFQVGSRMVLMGLRYEGTITTAVGEAHRTIVTVITRESYPKREDYSVLGVGFKLLAERATPQDFPHVAEYVRVPLSGGRDVKRFAPVEVPPKEFIEGNDGPPITLEDVLATVPEDRDGGGSDDPGF